MSVASFVVVVCGVDGVGVDVYNFPKIKFLFVGGVDGVDGVVVVVDVRHASCCCCLLFTFVIGEELLLIILFPLKFF